MSITAATSQDPHPVSLVQQDEQTGSRIAPAVLRAIDTMTNDFANPDGLGGLARDSFYSRFHFIREFTKLTGTSPRGFRSCLRLDHAKSLLLETPFSISEVCYMAGYSSVGTFSSRFRAMVGVTPRQWRKSGGDVPVDLGRHTDEGSVLHGTIDCSVHMCSPTTPVFVGVFADTLIQGDPVAWTYADAVGRFRLADVPDGTWRVALVAEATTATGHRQLRGYSREIKTTHDQIVHMPLNIDLRTANRLDPPVVRAGLLQQARNLPAGTVLAGG